MDSQEHPRALKKESVKSHNVPKKSITKEASDESDDVLPKHEPKPTYKSIKDG